METALKRRLGVAAALLGASAVLMTLVVATSAPPAHALTPAKCKKKKGNAKKKCYRKLIQQLAQQGTGTAPAPAPVPAPAPASPRATSLTLSCTDCGAGNTHAAGTVNVAGDLSPSIAGAYEPIRLDYGGLNSPKYLYTDWPAGGHYEGSFSFPGGTVPVTATFPGSLAGNFAPSSATITINP